MRAGTQPRRLLTWGQLGHAIRQTDWASTPPDGGYPILRVAAVVDALERRGHSFEHRRLANGTTEYRLIRPAAPDPEPSETPEPKRLMDVDPVTGCALRGWDA